MCYVERGLSGKRLRSASDQLPVKIWGPNFCHPPGDWAGKQFLSGTSQWLCTWQTSWLIATWRRTLSCLTWIPDLLKPWDKKYCYFSPGLSGSVHWVPTCKPKGHQFASQSGHTPGLKARSPVAMCERQPRVEVSLPLILPHFPSLYKINKENLLKIYCCFKSLSV